MNRFVSAAMLAAAALLLTAADGVAQGRTIAGKAFVFDANTLEVKGEKIRLFGIDAPDRKQTCLSEKRKSYPCGLRAAFALDNLAKGKTVSCQPRGIDSQNRILALCSHNGLDIGGAMVESGWAIADRRYSEMYVKTESAAEEYRRGLWQGEFEEPQSWRRQPRPLATQ
jgi:endonuclease YncB( thermonuclease family)